MFMLKMCSRFFGNTDIFRICFNRLIMCEENMWNSTVSTLMFEDVRLSMKYDESIAFKMFEDASTMSSLRECFAYEEFVVAVTCFEETLRIAMNIRKQKKTERRPSREKAAFGVACGYNDRS